MWGSGGTKRRERRWRKRKCIPLWARASCRWCTWPCSTPSIRLKGVTARTRLRYRRRLDVRRRLPVRQRRMRCWSSFFRSRKRRSMRLMRRHSRKFRRGAGRQQASAWEKRWRRRYLRCGPQMAPTLPIGSQWGNLTPWVMERGSQFRPAAPPALTSAEWARDYNEVKDIGGKKSTMRTPEQTEIARFWVITGPQSYDPIARQLAAAPGRSLIENARLFALVEMAVADAYVAVFDAKYTFNFWRPITAISNGDIDGNDATSRDAGWEPVIDTPLHPEYPCAHCITSGAARAVLESEFGTGAVSLSMTSASAPGVVHKWASIQEWAEEVAAARIYGGIHY